MKKEGDNAMWMEARTNLMQEKKAEQKLEFGMQIVNFGRQQTVGKSGRQAVPANGIYLDFSQEGMQNLTNRDGMLAQLVQRLEHVEKQTDAKTEELKILERCLKIALRIAAGDHVPQKDMQYLREHYPDLYAQAMLMRTPKKDPKEYESLLEDEEEATQENTGEASTETEGLSEAGGKSGEKLCG
mgnify:FL=1